MENKIVFTGPVGSGKTTAISVVSDIMVVATEAKASDEVAQRKENTTVAMDYGVLRLDGGMKVHLYGTPGQDRFDFMWEILGLGAMGFVILIDSLRQDPMADLETYVKMFRKQIAKCGDAVVIGLTRTEHVADVGLVDRAHHCLESFALNVPVFEVDGRQREHVKYLLQAIMAMINPAIGSVKAI